jgi:hypothetical protein
MGADNDIVADRSLRLLRFVRALVGSSARYATRRTRRPARGHWPHAQRHQRGRRRLPRLAVRGGQCLLLDGRAERPRGQPLTPDRAFATSQARNGPRLRGAPAGDKAACWPEVCSVHRATGGAGTRDTPFVGVRA